MKIRPIILSGGSGTRLWPVSRKRHPKQFAELLGQHSLLVTALEMIGSSDLFEPPTIIANEEHKFFVLDALKQANRADAAVLLEPCGRNTAAAAITAALAEPDGEETLHLLLPSDHIIKDPVAFSAAIKSAAAAAAKGRIALFGIEPSGPETGFGYILRGDKSEWPRVDIIASFREKPDAAAAQTLIKQGALWNSGIFLYAPATVIAEVSKLNPQQVELCQSALQKARMDLGCRELDKKAYEKLRDISFDHLVMENTQLGTVVPCKMGWSDVGSWHTLWQLEPKDESGNVLRGPVTARDVGNSYIRSEGPVVGVIGLQDIAIVATKDAILIAPRNRSQDVKNLVADLAAKKRNEATDHCRVMRPWGSYEGVAQGDRFQVKHIVVHPGQSLSLQMHNHRAEHWVVVTGTAAVECDDVKKSVFENQSVFIPKGSKHRLSNPGKVDLHLVEVQSGEYLGEDDIIRFSDIYGRVA